MSVDGTFNEYLGIGIEEVSTDKGKLGYQLTQEGLIKKIFSTTGMTDCNGWSTPTSGEEPLVTNQIETQIGIKENGRTPTS